MVALGNPGEIQELAAGLSEASQKLATTHEESVASLTGYARWLTAISWLTQALVYIIKMMEFPASLQQLAGRSDTRLRTSLPWRSSMS